MKFFSMILFTLIIGGLNAQVSFSAGGSMLKGFGTPKPWGGFHVGVEIPRDDAISLYGRFTHHFKQNAADSIGVFAVAKDFTTSPYSLNVSALPSMNYNIIEGGTRYYLGNGFDYGFAGYGGTNVALIFNKVKVGYSEFDESLYELDPNSRMEGSIFSLGFGLNGGVKYSNPPYGTFYLDCGMNYLIFAQGSTSSVSGELYNQLLFNVNIGYRKDILW